MKYLKKLPNFLLSLIFIVFGLNFFLNFIPLPPMEGNPATFMGVLYSTGYLSVIKVLEIVLGITLLIPQYKKISLIMLTPIVINILLFELLIVGAPGIGLLLTTLTCLSLYSDRKDYLKLIN
jgi:putative oxidoreductase